MAERPGQPPEDQKPPGPTDPRGADDPRAGGTDGSDPRFGELPGAQEFPGSEDVPAAEELAEPPDRLLRNSAVMAVGSILSRVTGVARDIALTAALGLYITADAFALGNSLPVIIYALVIGGALNAIFVPQLVRRMKDDADQGRAYTDSLLSLTGVIMVILTVVAVAAAPLIVRIYATNDFSQEQLDLAIAFARYCLPQIFFFGIYTMLAQVLNARGHFGMPMFAPIFNNIVAIITYVSFAVVVGPAAAASGSLTAGQTAWLGIGTTIGIVAQSLVLIPVLIRAGYKWRFSRRWRGMGMGKAGKLAGWTLGLVGVTQLGYVVASRLATEANVAALAAGEPPAGLAAFNKGYLVFMIPHGIVTVSLVTAQLPSLSREVHAGARRLAGGEIGHTMRLVAVVITPIALALFATSEPLSALLFNYGAASAEQASQLGVIIGIFMLGLLPFTLYYVLQRGWYAMEDTRTPFFFAVLMNTVYIVGALGLFNMIDGVGAVQVNAIASAYTLANWVMFLVAWPFLTRSYGFLDARNTLWALIRVAAAGVMALVAEIYLNPLPGYQIGESKGIALLDLTVSSLLILVFFLGLVRLLRVREISDIFAMIGDRLPGGRR